MGARWKMQGNDGVKIDGDVRCRVWYDEDAAELSRQRRLRGWMAYRGTMHGMCRFGGAAIGGWSHLVIVWRRIGLGIRGGEG